MKLWLYNRHECSVAISTESWEEHRLLTQESLIVPQETSINPRCSPHFSTLCRWNPTAIETSRLAANFQSYHSSKFTNRLLIRLFPSLSDCLFTLHHVLSYYVTLTYIFVEMTWHFTVSCLSTYWWKSFLNCNQTAKACTLFYLTFRITTSLRPSLLMKYTAVLASHLI